jgi:hypothetical protein
LSARIWKVGSVPTNDHVASKTERDVFDLHVSGTGGRGRGVVIEDTALAWQCAEQPRRRALDDITTVRIWVDLISGDLPTADCDITFADGERLRLMMVANTWKNMKYAEFEFVLSFFERLDPAQGWIIFCEPQRADTNVVDHHLGRLSGYGARGDGVWRIFGLDWSEDGWLFMSFLLIFTVATAVLLTVAQRQPVDPRQFRACTAPCRTMRGVQ